MRRRPFSSVMARRPVLILSSSARQGRDLRATTLAWSKDETQIRLKRQRVLHSFFLLLVPRGQKKKLKKTRSLGSLSSFSSKMPKKSSRISTQNERRSVRIYGRQRNAEIQAV